MSRELNDYWTSKKQKNEESISFQEWQELRKEVSDLHFQMKEAQSRLLLVHAKITQLFSAFKSKLEEQEKKHYQLEEQFKTQQESFQDQFKQFAKEQEQSVLNKVQDLIERQQQINKKYSYQLQDLCQSLTHQSEQVWSLNDEVQKIRKHQSSEKEKEI